MKRVDENKSHIREVLPGVTYVAPPKQDKLNIFTDDIEKIREKIAQSRKGMYKAVMEAIKGVSPIICREFEYGLTLDEFKSKLKILLRPLYLPMLQRILLLLISSSMITLQQ